MISEEEVLTSAILDEPLTCPHCGKPIESFWYICDRHCCGTPDWINNKESRSSTRCGELTYHRGRYTTKIVMFDSTKTGDLESIYCSNCKNEIDKDNLLCIIDYFVLEDYAD